MIRYKVNAQHADVRKEVCTHDHMPYRARYGMPCTGPRVCTMCGVTDAQLAQEKTE